jgi:hypothetical protein
MCGFFGPSEIGFGVGSMTDQGGREGCREGRFWIFLVFLEKVGFFFLQI